MDNLVDLVPDMQSFADPNEQCSATNVNWKFKSAFPTEWCAINFLHLVVSFGTIGWVQFELVHYTILYTILLCNIHHFIIK